MCSTTTQPPTTIRASASSTSSSDWKKAIDGELKRHGKQQCSRDFKARRNREREAKSFCLLFYAERKAEFLSKDHLCESLVFRFNGEFE
jgi:hypothetical protein